MAGMADTAATSISAPDENTPNPPHTDTQTSTTNSQPNEKGRQPPHPALATSKRKFHTLLENITKRPPSKRTNDAVSASSDSPAKRIRLEARARLEANTSSGTGVAAQVQSQLLRARLETARPSSGKDEPGQRVREPNYVPWSQDAFLRRMKTFADLRLWTGKPDAVNEVAWAKRGWVCVGVNTVACKGGCEQRVVVGLRPPKKDDEGNEVPDSEDYEQEVDEELVRRVEELIVQGHEDGCLWRDAGCKDDIYHLPIARPSVWQPQLRDRYRSFAAISGSLPAASRLLPSIDTERLASILPPELLQPESDPDSESTQSAEIDHVSLTFALLGWTGSLESRDYALATCNACFRRLGLWLYRKESPQASDDKETGDETDALMRLDLLNNHRDYCPWVNGTSQSMPRSMAGLTAHEVLIKCIENDAGFRGVSSRPSTPAAQITGAVEHETAVGAEENDVPSPAPTSLSKEAIEKEDKARFARLKELSKSIGLKGLRAKLGRARTANASRPSSAGVA